MFIPDAKCRIGRPDLLLLGFMSTALLQVCGSLFIAVVSLGMHHSFIASFKCFSPGLCVVRGLGSHRSEGLV